MVAAYPRNSQPKKQPRWPGVVGTGTLYISSLVTTMRQHRVDQKREEAGGVAPASSLWACGLSLPGLKRVLECELNQPRIHR
jgi:hypothetical protein